MALGVLFVS
uniref:Uncharacterized protein n=1 Tax=Arundo donax TaxID=35708 RepID=A0A0A9B4R0_ARUDO